MIDIVRRAIVDEYRPQSFTFSRNSLAYDDYGRLYYPHQARFETVSGRTGVLVEEGTTNLLKHSEALDNTSSWARTELAAVTPVAGASPAGTTAYVLVPTTANLAHSLVQGVTVAGGSGVYITLSCCFKAKEYNHARLTVRINDGSTNRWPLAIFRLTDGVVTRLDGRGVYTVTAQAVNVGGGWWRCALTVQVPAGHTVMDVAINASDNTGAEYFAGDGASGVYAWGAQLEMKAYMTSYMATTSSSATRAAETLTVPTAGVADSDEVTIEAWVYVNALARRNITDQWPTIFNLRQGTGGRNWVWLFHNYDGRWVLQLRDDSGNTIGGSTLNFASDTDTPDGWHYFAVALNRQTGAVRVALNGTVRLNTTLDFSNVLPFDRLYLGSRDTVFDWLNSFIGPVRISRRARTDQEIAAAYAAGTLGADADTTLLLDFSKGPYVRRAAKVIRAV